MWRTRVTFFPRCKQLCVIFVDRPYIWVTGRVCTRSNKKTHSMHAYVMKAHARWRHATYTLLGGGFIFERGPSFWHVRVNGFGIACSYTLAGRTRDLWKLRSRLFRLTVNGRFVVVLGRPLARFFTSPDIVLSAIYIYIRISFLNVIVVVKDTGVYLPENLSGVGMKTISLVSSINSRATAVNKSLINW